MTDSIKLSIITAVVLLVCPLIGYVVGHPDWFWYPAGLLMAVLLLLTAYSFKYT